LAFAYSCYQISWGVLVVAVPVVLAQMFGLRGGGSATGLIWALVGAAGGVGALLAGRVRVAGRERKIMAGALLLTALALWPVAAMFGIAGLVLGLALFGFAAGPADVAMLTLRQRKTDPRELGRVLSISMSLNMAGYPLGSAIAGMLIATSPSATFALAGLSSAIAAVAAWRLPRETAAVV
jgi:predicted MFS family arabinose efflux permease